MSEAPPGGEGPMAGLGFSAAFEEARPRLLGLAYRITGSLVDADDVVSEVWLRWHDADRNAIERPEAWLTTVTIRRALDWCRATKRRREAYVGPWLPEPVVTVGDAARAAGDPEAAAELAESLSLGFLVLLDRLDPVSRAVFLLADVWGWSFTEVASTVGRSEAACRQVASRARRRLRSEPPTLSLAAHPSHQKVVDRLLAALAAGDLPSTLELLAPEVVLVSDGGPTTHAARRPVLTADRVARFLLNLARRLPATDVELTSAIVNGAPGVVIRSPSTADVVMAFAVQGQQVARIWMILAPDKLTRLDSPPALH